MTMHPLHITVGNIKENYEKENDKSRLSFVMVHIASDLLHHSPQRRQISAME